MSRHDVLVIPRNGKMYRLEADGDLGYSSQVAREFSYVEPGHRKAMTIARPAHPKAPSWGPAFSTIPRKAEPATAQVCCYLVNSENVNLSNTWTREAWDAEPGSAEEQSTEPSALPARQAEEPPVVMGMLYFMAADTRGRLFKIGLGEGECSVKELEVAKERDAYLGLRNGLVAGRVPCADSSNQLVPLVNLSALVAPQTTETAAKSVEVAS